MTTLLTLAIKAALDGGEAILSIYNDPKMDFQVEKKSDNSPLTIADKAANKVIVELLQQSNLPILSEESVQADYSERKHWNRLWIVDPLDGTKEFIKRNGEFTVNIALVDNHVPVMGVIYVPVKRMLYFGDLLQGAYCVTNIDATGFTDLKTLLTRAKRMPLHEAGNVARVVASRSHNSPETQAYIDKIKEERGNVEIVSMGSSLKICLVAEGSADVYPRFAPTMEWDTAAGHAIVKATGKEIYLTDEKTPLRYNREHLLNPWFIVK
ncbi:MAG: 3'(2'),5'-bisphosphate nucleotidase CysQ [Marinifilaceae bacterium]